MNAAIENIMTRRSVRSFTQQEISQQDLSTIATAACYAPSAMNTQNWQFTVVGKRTNVERLSAAMAAQLGNSEYKMYSPAAVIIASAPRDYNFLREDCSCALQNMFLTAHALGIGSVWINQLRVICDEQPVRAILREFGMPDDHLVCGICALGYAAAAAKPAEKKLDAIHFAD